MRLLLISANTEHVNMRTLPWGLWCVASSARAAGHEVSTLDLMEAPDPLEATRQAVRRVQPELIGVSVRNIDDQRYSNPTFFLPKVRKVVDACREASPAPVVLGGAGYSIFPSEALEYLGADYGIQGEGEAALLVLLAALERGEPVDAVPGLFVRGRGAMAPRTFLPKLDLAPFPDDECLRELPSDPALWVPVQIRRGCALGCAYCSTAFIEGRQVRRRTGQAVVDWLTRHPAVTSRQLFLVDNNFNVPRQPAIDLCRAIIASRLHLRWRCILNPMNIDQELAELMARAGCEDVALGYEAGSAPMLHALNKSFTLEQIERGAKLLHGAGIKTMGFLLLGGPGETRETVLESLRFTDALPLASVNLTVGIRVYPSTMLYEQALADGQISAGDDLLQPHFYMAAGLEPWLDEELARWCATRPHWVR